MTHKISLRMFSNSFEYLSKNGIPAWQSQQISITYLKFFCVLK